jgi:putative redox protein
MIGETPQMAKEGEVTVIGGPKGFAQEIVAGHHRLAADEPSGVIGGTDTGPTPYDLLLAAIGACTSMTLRMYADLKKLPLEGVRVRLRHAKIHAADCASCATKAGRLDRIEREIELLGPLTVEQRLRLMEIADRCPVHRTLTSEMEIVSRLV